MNNLIPFDFEGRAVRVVHDDAGVPWFVARDVCECLGLANTSKAVDRLDEDERATLTIGDTSSSTRNSITVLSVNEPGLYSLTLTSRKPEAKRFKRWITHDVLPAIRKTGHYAVNDADAGAPPPVPLSATHRADVLVSATRTFAALARAGRTFRMGHARSLAAANLATFRATGIDLAEELGAQDLIAIEAPAVADAIAPQIASWVEDQDNVSGREIITGAALGNPDNRALQMRVGAVMRGLGWRKVKAHSAEGGSTWVYCRGS